MGGCKAGNLTRLLTNSSNLEHKREQRYKKFTEKIDNISALLKSIEPFEKSRVPKD